VKHLKSSRRFRVAATVFVLLAVVFGFAASRTPLLNVVGYELGFAAGIFIAAAGMILGAIAGRDTRRPDITANTSYVHLVNVKYAQCIIAGLLVLTPVFAIVSVTSFYSRKCNLEPGLPLFFAICIPSLFNYSAAGLAAGRLCRRALTTYLFLFGYFAATSIFSFLLFMSASQSSLPNLTVGLVSLAGFYGFGLSVPDTFYYWRLFALFMAVFFIGIAILSNPQQHIPRIRADIYIGRRDIIVSILVFLICLIAIPDQSGLGNGRRTINRELPEKLETPHAVLHFASGRLNHNEANRIARYTEWYIHEIRDAVPMKLNWKIHVYLYTDSKQMERLVGAPDFYFAAPWLHEVHISMDSVERDIYKHELAHTAMAVYGTGIFGTPYNIGVVEGTAEALQKDYFRGPAFQEFFAAAVKARVLAPAQQTMSTTGFGATNMWKSYEMAGGFIGYLLYEYGPGKFSRFYAGEDANKVYGKSISVLNSDWIGWLKNVPVSPHALRIVEIRYDDAEFPAFYKTECPRVGSRAHDAQWIFERLKFDDRYDEAAKMCADSFHKNSDPEWLVKRANMLQIAGKQINAISSADRVLSIKKTKAITKDNALLIKTCAFASLGRIAEAIATLEKRTAIGLSDSDRNEIMIRVLQSKTSRGIFQQEFCETHEMRNDILYEAIEKDPDFGILYAILALDTIKSGDVVTKDYPALLGRLVNKFMDNTDGLNKTKISLFMRLGDAYNNTGEYDKAAAAFQRILPLAENSRDLFIAKKRIERSRFFKSLKLSDIITKP
jgi:tetratricopeptide (TPR) repeat protein